MTVAFLPPIFKDSTLAAYASAIYDYEGVRVAWDHFQDDTPDVPVCVGVKYRRGATIVAIRGTVTRMDWMWNVDATPVDAGLLGTVALGFYVGVRFTVEWLLPLLKGDVFVSFHSRGGGIGPLVIAELLAAGVKVKRFVGLGPARSGEAALADYIAAIPGALYRSKWGPFRDLVPSVPFNFGGSFAYVHVRPLIDVPVTITKAAIGDMGAAAIHYAPGYVAALQAQGL